jgi:ABC-type glycerol-3-phosphate transport system substrate-binding protein
MSSKLSRRTFLRLAGVATAAALGACAPKVMPTAVPEQKAEAPKAEPTKAEATKVAQAPTAAPAAGKKVKIQVCDLVAEDATGPGVFAKIKYTQFAELFPDIEVEHVAYPDVLFEKRKEYWLTAYAEGGTNAVMFDTNKWAWEFGSLKKALILDDYIPLYFQEDWDSLVTVAQKLSTYDSHVVQIPGMIEVHGLVVRRDYLKEVGLAEDYTPKNWPEFLDMIKKLTTDKYYGFQWKTYMRAMSEFLHMNGGDFAIENPDKTIDLHYTKKELVEVLEMLKSCIYPNRYIQQNTLQEFAQNLNAFQQGQSATFNMMPSWVNWLFGVTEFGPEDLNYFCYPIGKSGEAKNGERPAYVDCGSHSWVANPYGTPEQNDAVAHYLCWMNSKENIKKQGVWWRENELKGAYASPFKDVPWTTVSAGIPDWWAAPLEQILSLGDVDPAPDYAPGRSYVDAACAEILNDQNSDVQAMLQAAEDKTKREFLDEYHKKLGKS